jgi:KUP system potassium uptake protein
MRDREAALKVRPRAFTFGGRPRDRDKARSICNGRAASGVAPYRWILVAHRPARHRRVWCWARALGVVYGDIGTSPLYAIKECFAGEHGLQPTAENVLGILSLVFWALLVVVVKYLTFIMRADNRGEGGIFALLALLAARDNPRRASSTLGLFGAALLYGDGVITPAISVLSAVEGLELAAPELEPSSCRSPSRSSPRSSSCSAAARRASAPCSARRRSCGSSASRCGSRGSARAARAAGVRTRLRVRFFRTTATTASSCSARSCSASRAARRSTPTWATSAAPDSLAWYSVVFPRCSSTTSGRARCCSHCAAQVAARCQPPSSARSTRSCPSRSSRWSLIATVATVVASQALISGAFSLTQQAVQLGFLPRVQIIHTSATTEGQIFVPVVNARSMVACIALVLVAGSSSQLAPRTASP